VGVFGPINWVLPIVLVVVWAPLWATRRRTRLWFLATALVGSVLCFPAGVIAGDAEIAAHQREMATGVACSPDNLCASMWELHWWLNGLSGLGIWVLLAATTIIVEMAIAIKRRIALSRSALLIDECHSI
jgi:hypothetical protein